jgi:glycosyltransferase involved in cell wall biosynthesis
MQCETAVISSREGALAETVGDAGLFIDPHDVSSIREAMLKVISPDVQSDLIKKGRLQSTQFSWKETGRQTIEVYNSL